MASIINNALFVVKPTTGLQFVPLIDPTGWVKVESGVAGADEATAEHRTKEKQPEENDADVPEKEHHNPPVAWSQLVDELAEKEVVGVVSMPGLNSIVSVCSDSAVYRLPLGQPTSTADDHTTSVGGQGEEMAEKDGDENEAKSSTPSRMWDVIHFNREEDVSSSPSSENDLTFGQAPIVAAGKRSTVYVLSTLDGKPVLTHLHLDAKTWKSKPLVNGDGSEDNVDLIPTLGDNRKMDLREDETTLIVYGGHNQQTQQPNHHVFSIDLATHAVSTLVDTPPPQFAAGFYFAYHSASEHLFWCGPRSVVAVCDIFQQQATPCSTSENGKEVESEEEDEPWGLLEVEQTGPTPNSDAAALCVHDEEKVVVVSSPQAGESSKASVFVLEFAEGVWRTCRLQESASDKAGENEEEKEKMADTQTQPDASADPMLPALVPTSKHEETTQSQPHTANPSRRGLLRTSSSPTRKFRPLAPPPFTAQSSSHSHSKHHFPAPPPVESRSIFTAPHGLKRMPLHSFETENWLGGSSSERVSNTTRELTPRNRAIKAGTAVPPPTPPKFMPPSRRLNKLKLYHSLLNGLIKHRGSADAATSLETQDKSVVSDEDHVSPYRRTSVGKPSPALAALAKTLRTPLACSSSKQSGKKNGDRHQPEAKKKKKSKKLTLNLEGTQPAETDWVVIANTLHDVQSISGINVAGTVFDDISAEIFVGILRDNPSITKVNTAGASFPESFCVDIIELLAETNSSKKEEYLTEQRERKRSKHAASKQAEDTQKKKQHEMFVRTQQRVILEESIERLRLDQAYMRVIHHRQCLLGIGAMKIEEADEYQTTTRDVFLKEAARTSAEKLFKEHEHGAKQISIEEERTMAGFRKDHNRYITAVRRALYEFEKGQRKEREGLAREEKMARSRLRREEEDGYSQFCSEYNCFKKELEKAAAERRKREHDEKVKILQEEQQRRREEEDAREAIENAIREQEKAIEMMERAEDTHRETDVAQPERKQRKEIREMADHSKMMAKRNTAKRRRSLDRKAKEKVPQRLYFTDEPDTNIQFVVGSVPSMLFPPGCDLAVELDLPEYMKQEHKVSLEPGEITNEAWLDAKRRFKGATITIEVEGRKASDFVFLKTLQQHPPRDLIAENGSSIIDAESGKILAAVSNTDHELRVMAVPERTDVEFIRRVLHYIRFVRRSKEMDPVKIKVDILVKFGRPGRSHLTENELKLRSTKSINFDITMHPPVFALPNDTSRIMYAQSSGDGLLLQNLADVKVHLSDWDGVDLVFDMGPAIEATDWFCFPAKGPVSIEKSNIICNGTLVGHVATPGALLYPANRTQRAAGSPTEAIITLRTSATQQSVATILKNIAFRSESKEPINVLREVKVGIVAPELHLRAFVGVQVDVIRDDEPTVIELGFPHLTYRKPQAVPLQYPFLDVPPIPLYFLSSGLVFDVDTAEFNGGYIELEGSDATVLLSFDEHPENEAVRVSDAGDQILVEDKEVAEITYPPQLAPDDETHVVSERARWTNLLRIELGDTSVHDLNSLVRSIGVTINDASDTWKTITVRLVTESTPEVTYNFDVYVDEQLARPSTVFAEYTAQSRMAMSIGNVSLHSTQKLWDGGFIMFDYPSGWCAEDSLYIFEQNGVEMTSVDAKTQSKYFTEFLPLITASRRSVSALSDSTFKRPATIVNTKAFHKKKLSEKLKDIIQDRRTTHEEMRIHQLMRFKREGNSNAVFTDMSFNNVKHVSVNGVRIGFVVQSSSGLLLVFESGRSYSHPVHTTATQVVGSGEEFVASGAVPEHLVATVMQQVHYNLSGAEGHRIIRITCSDGQPHVSSSLIEVEVSEKGAHEIVIAHRLGSSGVVSAKTNERQFAKKRNVGVASKNGALVYRSFSSDVFGIAPFLDICLQKNIAAPPTPVATPPSTPHTTSFGARKRKSSVRSVDSTSLPPPPTERLIFNDVVITVTIAAGCHAPSDQLELMSVAQQREFWPYSAPAFVCPTTRKLIERGRAIGNVITDADNQYAATNLTVSFKPPTASLDVATITELTDDRLNDPSVITFERLQKICRLIVFRRDQYLGGDPTVGTGPRVVELKVGTKGKEGRFRHQFYVLPPLLHNPSKTPLIINSLELERKRAALLPSVTPPGSVNKRPNDEDPIPVISSGTEVDELDLESTSDLRGEVVQENLCQHIKIAGSHYRTALFKEGSIVVDLHKESSDSNDILRQPSMAALSALRNAASGTPSKSTSLSATTTGSHTGELQLEWSMLPIAKADRMKNSVLMNNSDAIAKFRDAIHHKALKSEKFCIDIVDVEGNFVVRQGCLMYKGEYVGRVKSSKQGQWSLHFDFLSNCTVGRIQQILKCLIITCTDTVAIDHTGELFYTFVSFFQEDVAVARVPIAISVEKQIEQNFLVSEDMELSHAASSSMDRHIIDSPKHSGGVPVAVRGGPPIFPFPKLNIPDLESDHEVLERLIKTKTVLKLVFQEELPFVDPMATTMEMEHQQELFDAIELADETERTEAAAMAASGGGDSQELSGLRTVDSITGANDDDRPIPVETGLPQNNADGLPHFLSSHECLYLNRAELQDRLKTATDLIDSAHYAPDLGMLCIELSTKNLKAFVASKAVQFNHSQHIISHVLKTVARCVQFHNKSHLVNAMNRRDMREYAITVCESTATLTTNGEFSVSTAETGQDEEQLIDYRTSATMEVVRHPLYIPLGVRQELVAEKLPSSNPAANTVKDPLPNIVTLIRQRGLFEESGHFVIKFSSSPDSPTSVLPTIEFAHTAIVSPTSGSHAAFKKVKEKEVPLNANGITFSDLKMLLGIKEEKMSASYSPDDVEIDMKVVVLDGRKLAFLAVTRDQVYVQVARGVVDGKVNACEAFMKVVEVVCRGMALNFSDQRTHLQQLGSLATSVPLQVSLHMFDIRNKTLLSHGTTVAKTYEWMSSMTPSTNSLNPSIRTQGSVSVRSKSSAPSPRQRSASSGTGGPKAGAPKAPLKPKASKTVVASPRKKK